MKTREPVTFKVFIPEREVASLLDMLRYDGAVVTAWDRTKDARDRDGWLIILRSDTFTPDRWKSFGILPVTQCLCGWVNCAMDHNGRS